MINDDLLTTNLMVQNGQQIQRLNNNSKSVIINLRLISIDRQVRKSAMCIHIIAADFVEQKHTYHPKFDNECMLSAVAVELQTVL